MKSNIFATGKTGTIGKHFQDFILDLEVDLTKISDLSYKHVFSPNDIIIHAAGVVGNNLVENELEKAYKINVDGTRELAYQAIRSNVHKFVFISSSHVYARSKTRLDELSRVEPITKYGELKLISEQDLMSIFKNNLTKLCIVRVFSVLDWDVKDFTLGGGIKKLADPNSTYFLNYALDIRDFLSPRQIANVITEIAKNDKLNGIVNVCSSSEMSIEQAARIMLEGRNLRIPENRILRVNSEIPYLVGDNTKLISHLPNLDLAWKPTS
jgi:nucleoside-diphosphate-sugar epimerase